MKTLTQRSGNWWDQEQEVQWSPEFSSIRQDRYTSSAKEDTVTVWNRKCKRFHIIFSSPNLSIFISLLHYQSISHNIFSSINLSIFISILNYQSISQSIYLSTYTSIYLFIYLFYLSIYLSTYLSIYISIYISISRRQKSRVSSYQFSQSTVTPLNWMYKIYETPCIFVYRRLRCRLGCPPPHRLRPLSPLF